MLIETATNILLYGKGVFTTVAIINGKAFLREKHWRRIAGNAAKVDINLAEHSQRSTYDALDDAIAASGICEGRARITFLDETPGAIWCAGAEQKTKLSIIVAGRFELPQPFKLTISQYPVNSRSPLAGVKSCNYLEPLLSLDEARGRGSDEAVRLNEHGYVTSGCMANIFWLKDEVLYTPSLATGCLAGTTREFVLEKLEVREVEAKINELANADAIYLTSAGLGIAAAAEYNGRKLPNPRNPITELLIAG